MASLVRFFHKINFWAVFYIVLFMVVCSTPLFGLLVGYENPNLEKSTLSPAPALLVDGKINLNLTQNIDDYYADHFAFRSYLVSGYHQLNQVLLAQSGNQKVISGQSGWLFFADALPDFLAVPTLSSVQLRRLATILSIQQNYLAEQGVVFQFTIAPNKSSIYGDFMPDRFAPVQPLNNMGKWLASPYSATVNTIDLLNPLRQAASDSTDPLYHRTDSHWNNLGARVGFQTIMASIAKQFPGFVYDDYRQTPYSVRTDWQGDLAVMLFPAGVQSDMQQYFDTPQTYRTLKPMRSLEDLLIQTSRIQISSPALGDSKKTGTRSLKLLMFRDSFANALIPFLANSFTSATFSREIPYNYTNIDRDKPDVVVLEIVERNLGQLLLRAPILPAPSRPQPLESVQSVASRNTGDPDSLAVNRLFAEPSGTLLKICGQLSGQSTVLNSVGSLCFGLNGPDGQLRYIVAFPVDETDQMGKQSTAGLIGKPSIDHSAKGLNGVENETIGLTGYLSAGTWTAGSQIVQVWSQMDSGWNRQDITITLP
jgi:hypothetical protein